eukprot:CAMPEP_0115430108 /NCGR_PEP_ID=MMETSP0271-20121206/30874_1 /TAXON_ID=71861 /ORGANISM="Scrippsiella trochoidea, Strain CCMP3099" /LENGTH=122 /DNA_ID=CAMNT_0002855325 /DNA_START=123 /DNA_END=487 /DNA_ORIENTATION=+
MAYALGSQRLKTRAWLQCCSWRQASQWFDSTGGPSLRTQSIRDVIQALGIHAEVAVAHSGGGADADARLIHANLEIVDKGLASVEEPGEVPDAREVLDAGIARAAEFVFREIPAALVNAVLA